MSKRWYAVQAYSGYEKVVQKRLIDRVDQSGLKDDFGDILVPVEEVVEMKSGQNAGQIPPNQSQFYAKTPHSPLGSHWTFSLLPQGCIWTLKMAEIYEIGLEMTRLVFQSIPKTFPK